MMTQHYMLVGSIHFWTGGSLELKKVNLSHLHTCKETWPFSV